MSKQPCRRTINRLQHSKTAWGIVKRFCGSRLIGVGRLSAVCKRLARISMMKQLLITIAAVVLVGCGPPRPPNIYIHIAAHEGNIEAVKQHIAAGTDVNKKTSRNESTPLHSAASNGQKDIVELLIANGADLNAKDLSGDTPLHDAATGGHKEVAELLIAEGADVNAKDNFEYTPLHCAAFDGHKKVAELLIAKGADLNAMAREDNSQLTPLDAAIEFGGQETADLLRKHGAKTAKELKPLATKPTPSTT